KDAAQNAKASFFSRLDSLGFPFAVPRQNRNLMATVGNLTPFWAAFVPSGTADSHGLATRVAAALGVPETPSGGSGSDQTAQILADRIARYVEQHSYVRSLVVNVVNPGDGMLLVEVLLDLQRRTHTKELTYDLRLCVQDTAMPGIGEALADLTKSDSRFTSDEAEAFGARLGHGIPKIAYSVRSTQEFEQNP
ncbi:hypothetical protein, partial [Streptomyces rhizosphaericus]